MCPSLTPQTQRRVSKLCLHRKKNLAYVTLDSRVYYLGRPDQPGTNQCYHQIIAEWLAGSGRFAPQPDEFTINELIDRFWQHACQYYRKPGGQPTGEAEVFKLALRPLRQLYGCSQASRFGPLALKTIRQKMIDKGWCRTTVNRMTGRIKHVFRWGVENELLQGGSYHALQAIMGLKRGRCEARESEPVRPVSQESIDAIQPHVSRQVWAIVQMQLFTGARPGEILIMRPCDIDRSGRIWVYKPSDHKTASRGLDRDIYIGPRGQEVLSPFLLRPPEAFCFSPAEALGEWLTERHAARITPIGYGNRPGSSHKETPARSPGHRYTIGAYRRAIARGCEYGILPPAPLARLEGESHRKWQARLSDEQKSHLKDWRKQHSWHPHQLRHNAATFLRKEFNLDTARIILGHQSAAITQIYAEADREKAIEAMLKVG